MILEVRNIQGGTTGRTIELPDSIFGIQPNEHVVYLAVKQYLAHQRQGTHKAKERSEMSGSTRKLHRQKGTGGARKGDINNPLYPGGGRVFGPKPHDYVIRLNKKVKCLARKSAFSAKAAAGNIVVLEDINISSPKTKDMKSIVAGLNLADKKTLLVTGDYNWAVYKSADNLPKLKVEEARNINTYQIMAAGAIVLTESSVAKIAETLA